MFRSSALLLLACGLSACASNPSRPNASGEIVQQPAKDVGAIRTDIPEVLREAAGGPYTLDGLGKCGAIGAEIARLNGALGEDYAGSADTAKSRKFRVTGDTVAGLIVPFRGVVREISGAAPAQREKNAAIDAGLARRGFLRGVYQTRRCKPAL